MINICQAAGSRSPTPTRTGARLLLVACLWTTAHFAPAAAPPVLSGEAVAARELERLKVKIYRDRRLPGQPVSAVQFFIPGTSSRHFALLPQFRFLREFVVTPAQGGFVSEFNLDRVLVHLRRLGSLETLHLGAGVLTDAGLVHLEPLYKLRELAISGDVTDAGLKSLSGLREVRNLFYLRASLKGDGLKHLAGLRHLAYLFLDRSTITPKALAALPPLPALAHLSLGDESLTDAHLVNLRTLPVLRSLDLHNTTITGKTLSHLARHPKLCELDLHGSQLSDAGCRELAHLPRLKQLNLSDTAISNASITTLARLRNLSRLNVTGTRIDEHGLRRLRKALPATDIDPNPR